MAALDDAELLLQAKNYSGAGNWLDEANAHDGTITNAIFKKYPDPMFIGKPGNSDGYGEIADHASFDLSGDTTWFLDMVIDEAVGEPGMLVGRRDGSGTPGKVWILYINTGGNFGMDNYDADGVFKYGHTTPYSNLAAVGERVQIKFEYEPDNGSSQEEYSIYKRAYQGQDLLDPTGWTLVKNQTVGTEAHTWTADDAPLWFHRFESTYIDDQGIFRFVWKEGLGESGTTIVDTDFTKVTEAEEAAGSFTEDGPNALTCSFNGDGVYIRRPQKYAYLPGASTDYIDTPTSTNLDPTDDVTFLLDIQLDDYTPAADTGLARRYITTGNHRQWHIRSQPAGNIQLIIGDGSGAYRYSFQPNPGLTDGQRYQIKIELDADNGSTQTQCNMFYRQYGGQDLWTDDTGWTDFSGDLTVAGTQSWKAVTAPLEVGRGDTASYPTGDFYRFILADGIGGGRTKMADVDLNDDSVAEPFSTFTEQSANAATMTINRAGRGNFATTIVDQAMWLFDSNTTYITIPDHANLDIGASDDATVVLVYRLYDLYVGTHDRLLFKKSVSGSSGVGWGMMRTLNDYVQGLLSDGTTQVTDQKQTVVTARERHISAMVVNRTADELTTWLDATEENSPGTPGTTDANTTDDVLVMAQTNAGNRGHGVVMAVAFWTRALSDAEIAGLEDEFFPPVVNYVSLDGAGSAASSGGLQSRLILDGDGDSITTPDSVPLSVTGDIDIRFDGSDGWDDAAIYTPIRKDWYLQLGNTGTLAFAWYDSLDNFNAKESTTAVPFGAGRGAVRVTVDVDNGASDAEVTFYTADTIAGPWTQLGSVVLVGATTDFRDNGVVLRIGAFSATLQEWPGTVFASEMYDGIDGTRVLNYRGEDDGQADSEGNTWSFSGDAYVIGDNALSVTRGISGTGSSSSSGTSSLTIERPLAGSGAASSTGSSSLTIKVLLSGTGSSSSQGDADLTVLALLSGSGSASGQGTGDLTVIAGVIDLAGTGSSSSSASGDLLVKVLLSGTGSSSSEGASTVTVFVPLAGSGSSSSDGSSEISVVILLAGIGASSATSSAELSIFVPLDGSAGASSDASISVSVQRALSGTGTASSEGSGDLSPLVSLGGVGSASSHSTSSITRVRAVSGIGSSASVATGIISVVTPLDGTGSSASSGTATLTVKVELAGIGASSASGSVTLVATRSLVGFGSASSIGDGLLKTAIDLDGSGTGASSGSGSLSATYFLAGTGSTSSTSTTSITIVVQLAGQGSNTNIGKGDLDAGTTKLLAGIGSSSSEGSADLTATWALSGSGATSSEGSGDVTLFTPLSGFGSASSEASTQLSVSHSLAGIGTASSGGDASLTILVLLSGAGDEASGGSGDLDAGATTNLIGVGAIASTGTSDLSVTWNLAGTGSSSSEGSGNLLPLVSIGGEGSASSSGSGAISRSLALTGSAASVTAGSAGITITVILAGTGVGSSIGSGDLLSGQGVLLSGSGAAASFGYGAIRTDTVQLGGMGAISAAGAGSLESVWYLILDKRDTTPAPSYRDLSAAPTARVTVGAPVARDAALFPPDPDAATPYDYEPEYTHA
jgi:hypothetical protein